MNSENIILIGMPACGKSTIGVNLAKLSGYDFLDSDLLIQRREGKLLRDLIREKGIEGFIAIENQVNQSLQVHGCVIATGGSVVYGAEAMEHLRKLGTVVYLKLPLAELEKRLGSLERRGVVCRGGSTVAALYEERTPLYEAYAHTIVEAEGCTVDELVEEVYRSCFGTRPVYFS
jgi:shikimate kinase